MSKKELKKYETMTIAELLSLIEELLKQVKIRLVKRQHIQNKEIPSVLFTEVRKQEIVSS